MPRYDFKCSNEHVFEEHVFLNDRDIPIPCPKCSSPAKRIFISAPKIEIKEGMNILSSKPDSYWDNAEEQRIKKQADRRAEQKEKIHYDAEYRKKVELADARKRYFQDEDD